MSILCCHLQLASAVTFVAFTLSLSQPVCGQSQGHPVLPSPWETMERAGHLSHQSPVGPLNPPVEPLIQFASVEGTLPAQQLQETLETEDILAELDREQDKSLPSLSRHKSGFFQSLDAGHTWVSRGSSSSFGLQHVRGSLSVAVPLPNRESPLLIQPSFGVYSFSGPDSFAVPSRFYDATLSMIWLPRVTERWQAIVAVAPGVYADFESTTSDSLRIKGAGLLRYRWNERLDVQLGVAYLDRADIGLVPAAGFIWQPSDDYLFEISMPRPKVGRRLFVDSDSRQGPRETWVYLAGELGGETWTVETGPSAHRQMTLREYRLLAGIERVREGGGGWRVETGLAFDRRLLFSSPEQTVRGDDAFVLRASLLW